MDNILTEDLKKQFEALPVEIQKAISDVDLPIKLQEIVKNNKLMIDQAGGLETETILVLFGLESLENYVKNLIANVGLSSIQASIVAHDVNESIFKNIRESLKKINDQTSKEENINERPADLVASNKKTGNISGNLAKEDVLAGIENPENIKNNEERVSVSSQKSNSLIPETYETIDKGIEIKINNLPEIAPKIIPMTSFLSPKQTEPFHENTSPIENIVESKLANTVIVPKETIIVEEKTKLPEKSKISDIPQKPQGSSDPYREPTI